MTGSPKKIERVGLALSGGGFRAAAFHLGVLDYLEKTGLLNSVRALSTVSGGTFTGAIYAVALARRVSVPGAFRAFYETLRATPFVSKALHLLAAGTLQRPSKRQSLIIAASDVYDEHLFGKGDADESLRFGLLDDMDTTLEEISFNATEFRTGVAFRFLKSQSNAAKRGNGNVTITKETLGKLRLADIVAASSCFPGGFEPLVFPGDFDWPDGVPDDLKASLQVGALGPVALMDGGVYDNQGIDAIQLVENRPGGHLDLIIISDVDQKQDTYYTLPRQPKRGNFRLGHLYKLGLALFAGCVVAIPFVMVQLLFGDGSLFTRLLANGVPLVLLLTVGYLLWWMRSMFRSEVESQIREIGEVKWETLSQLRLSQVFDMLQLRATTLIAMSTSIFMKRVRGLVYSDLYGERGSQGKTAPVACDIESLETRAQRASVPEPMKPSDALLKVANVAAAMPTALWWDHDQQLPALVATGQATICVELLAHLDRLATDDQPLGPELQALRDVLVSDWQHFRDDPHWQVRERFDGAVDAGTRDDSMPIG